MLGDVEGLTFCLLLFFLITYCFIKVFVRICSPILLDESHILQLLIFTCNSADENPLLVDLSSPVSVKMAMFFDNLWDIKALGYGYMIAVSKSSSVKKV